DEWSMNLSRASLVKALRVLPKSLAAGFSKTEAEEGRAATDDISPHEEGRLKVEVEFNGKKQPPWVVVFFDDENEFEIFFFGSKELINAVTKAQSRLFREKFEEI